MGTDIFQLERVHIFLPGINAILLTENQPISRVNRLKRGLSS